MTWTKPEYGRSQVDKAGHILTDPQSTEEQTDNALNILSNWRSSHSYPMNTFQVRLRRESKKIDSSALVVQRLKRVPSILKKLQRTQTKSMSLSQMQDIAGCRAVMQDVAKAYALSNVYKKSRGLKHKRVREKDYIKEPKNDGYRGIHLVYKYKSDKITTYDGLQVELQIRSKIQHAWATSIEIVDLFTDQAIKSNEGEQEWKDFFKLISSVFARMEGQPPVPDTPTDDVELYERVKEKVSHLKIISKMTGWSDALKAIEPKIKELQFFLLELDVTEGNEKLSIRGYPLEQEPIATEHYVEAERLQNRNPNKDVVLVGAKSVEELRKAYLNYFADSKEFLQLIQQYLQSGGKTRTETTVTV